MNIVFEYLSENSIQKFRNYPLPPGKKYFNLFYNLANQLKKAKVKIKFRDIFLNG